MLNRNGERLKADSVQEIQGRHGGEETWLPRGSWCFSDVKTWVWHIHQFFSYLFTAQTQEQMRMIKVHWQTHDSCFLHDFKARWSTCPWLPKVGRKNYTQYLWNNTFSLSSLSKPCLKFKVIHKEETKFSNFLLFFFSHLGTYLFQKYPQISLFSQGNQYTQPREQ